MTRILGMLALILILFEGGIELRLKEAIRYSPGGLLLALVSYGLTVGLVAAVARYSLHLSWLDGALLGSVLGSTSAAVVLPAIQQMDVPSPIKITLTLESSLGEIIAVLTVGTLIGLQSDVPVVEGLISRVRPPRVGRRGPGHRGRRCLVADIASPGRPAIQQRTESGDRTRCLCSWAFCRWKRASGGTRIWLDSGEYAADRLK